MHTVETKINERFKVFETTMQKSFIEQVTRMEGRFKEHISRCEKQTTDVAKKVDSLEVKIQTDVTETQRRVDTLDASIVETRSNIAVSYTHLDVYKRQVPYDDQGVRRNSIVKCV